MAAHGYLVYLLRANSPSRSRALQRLSECGDEGHDLLEVLEKQVSKLADDYHSDAKTADGFRVRDLKQPGRSLWLRINKGPEGGTGETYDLESGLSTDTSERTALLSGLRAYFLIPDDSYFGLLFVERIGARNLKDLLYRFIVRTAAVYAASVVRLEAFAEAEDWTRELRTKQALRVSELLYSTDGSEDASTPHDTTVKVITEGPALRRASGKIKDLIIRRINRRDEKLELLTQIAPLESRRRIVDEKSGPTPSGRPTYKNAPRSAFSVEDEAQYKSLLKLISEKEQNETVDGALTEELESVSPIDRQSFRTKRFEVAVGEERPERTFVVESDAMPQFVYETGTRLSDSELLELWKAHGERVLRNRGVQLPAGWLES